MFEIVCSYNLYIYIYIYILLIIKAFYFIGVRYLLVNLVGKKTLQTVRGYRKPIFPINTGLLANPVDFLKTAKNHANSIKKWGQNYFGKNLIIIILS